MNVSDSQKARIEEINAEITLASYRARARVLRESDIDTISDRWTEYVICRPFWSTRWYPQPPPATKRRLA